MTQRIVSTLNAADVGFSEALETCRQFLLAIANAELPVHLRAKCGASDLVQDSLLMAHRVGHQFRGRTLSDLRTWLRSILASKLAGTHRRYLGTAARDVTRERPGGASGVAAADSPPDELIRRESDERLATALGGLPDESRRAVVLRIDGGHSFAEIGARLGRTEEAARKLFTRAVVALREMTRSSQEAPCPTPN